MTGVREALIIAIGTYDDPQIRRLRSPAADASELAAVLSNRAIGNYSVQTLVDNSSYDCRQTIEAFFQDRNRDDLLLLHLSCHGIKDDNGRLHFATADTKPNLLGSTAISAGFVNKHMEGTRARSVILLLDCCYSGAFRPGSRDDRRVHLGDEFRRLAPSTNPRVAPILGQEGTGKAVLTATNAVEYAWDGDHRLEEPVPSVFTSAIVAGLSSGDADLDNDGFVSLDELYEYVRVALRDADRKQSPQRWLLGVNGDLRIAKNPFPEKETPPPQTEGEGANATRPARARRRAGSIAAVYALTIALLVVTLVLVLPLIPPDGGPSGPTAQPEQTAEAELLGHAPAAFRGACKSGSTNLSGAVAQVTCFPNDGVVEEIRYTKLGTRADYDRAAAHWVRPTGYSLCSSPTGPGGQASYSVNDRSGNRQTGTLGCSMFSDENPVTFYWTNDQFLVVAAADGQKGQSLPAIKGWWRAHLLER